MPGYSCGARSDPEVAGYEEMLDVLTNPAQPDCAEHAAWTPDLTYSDAPFDPAFLDITAVN